MPYRNGNYCAFYVTEPFCQTNLGANTAKDFCYYRTLQAWKAKDLYFPFIDSHQKTYSVRDGSEWETLKERLHERLRNSKNIILFLSSNTKNSRALHEEIDYGINKLNLPVVVVYPELEIITDIYGNLTNDVKNLWNNLPIFRDSMNKVKVAHVLLKKDDIKDVLNNPIYSVNG